MRSTGTPGPGRYRFAGASPVRELARRRVGPEAAEAGPARERGRREAQALGLLTVKTGPLRSFPEEITAFSRTSWL
jgi:hypothetical protein